MRAALLLLAALVLGGCSGSPSAGPTAPDGGGPPVAPPTSQQPPQAGDPPSSRNLAAVVSLAFGDSPVEGFAYLLPGEDGVGARYTVDLDEDGRADREGVLVQGIGFAYRFTAPGVHRIRGTFQTAQGTRPFEAIVVVNDPSAVRTLATAQLVPHGDHNSFEGLVVDHAGRHLYAGNYSGGTLDQLDARDLRPLRRIDSMGYSIEGLAIPPSDSLLFAVYKYHHLATVAIPSAELRRLHPRVPSAGAFYIHALDDRRVLTSGRSEFGLQDPLTGQTLGTAVTLTGSPLRGWHFAVSPDGSTAAVVDRSESYQTIHFVDVLTLRARRTYTIPSIDYVELVAFDPHEDRLYAMGNDVNTAHFFVIDLATGEILRDMPLGPSYCGSYCVANPVATSASGRFVAIEWSGGAYIIDTELDLPLYRIGHYGFSGYGFSVAASPQEEVFYFLDSGGEVRKVAVR